MCLGGGFVHGFFSVEDVTRVSDVCLCTFRQGVCWLGSLVLRYEGKRFFSQPWWVRMELLKNREAQRPLELLG